MKFKWAFRALLYRIFNYKIKAIYIGKPINIKGFQRIRLDNGVGIYPGSRLEVQKKMKLKIGENTRIGHLFFVDASSDVTIGANCTFSSNVFISTAIYDWENIRFNGFKNSEIASKPVIIGNNVFIGINSVIFPGVTIEDNVVVGANSIVNKDLKKETIFYNEVKSIFR
jgi:acetyltransferase-like isoleucine patch superfamily enzyme